MNNNLIINNYNIFLDIDIQKLIYSGKVYIDLIIKNHIEKLEINSKKIKILSIKINNNNCVWDEDKQNEIIIIKYNYVPNNYKIEIIFINHIDEEMYGLYHCNKNNDLILCTHLEPTSARSFIPCFDIPNIKSIFLLTVCIDKHLTGISNNSIRNVHFDKKINKKIISFNPTPIMSTYLLCLVIGNLSPVLTQPLITNDNILINGYSLEIDKKYMGWSITHSKQALEFFTKWFGIKYPLDKFDIVCIPNLISDAMENWGCVTFREKSILLNNPNNYYTKIIILKTLYHEIAHQWFGNLVTLRNWNDLWLNESTATFFSWMALQINYPNYNIAELYWLLAYKNIILCIPCSHFNR